LNESEGRVSPTRLIGVGNPLRRDDGVGPTVIRHLIHKLPPGIAALEHGGDGAGLMALWEGATRVILVDAACSSAAPGTIHRLNARETVLPRELFHHSSHLFGLAEAVEMARSLGRLPRRIMVYGIAGENFDYGEDLSPPVAKAAREAAELILHELSTGVASA
jgi:hydrogenase maturation protease